MFKGSDLSDLFVYFSILCPKKWLTNVKTFNIAFLGGGGGRGPYKLFSQILDIFVKSTSVANSFDRDYRFFKIENFDCGHGRLKNNKILKCIRPIYSKRLIFPV